MKEETIYFDSAREAHAFLGAQGRFIPHIEERFKVSLVQRDAWIKLTGEPEDVERGLRFFDSLKLARNNGIRLIDHGIEYALQAFDDGREEDLSSLHRCRIKVSNRKPNVYPRTFGQEHYVRSIKQFDLSFGIGPAGTGKTYLAMALAVEALLKQEVSRIILTRPAIEAGEALGFLPGDLQQKVAPYLRPLHDALYDVMDAQEVERFSSQGLIEVAPLAYMRGRTLNGAFVILDEGQNTTSEQMFMFLTRLGFDSKCVITGDLSQVDLPNHKTSGLAEARRILANVPGISFSMLNDQDIVRHHLVQKIIQAYRSARSGDAQTA